MKADCQHSRRNKKNDKQMLNQNQEEGEEEQRG